MLHLDRSSMQRMLVLLTGLALLHVNKISTKLNVDAVNVHPKHMFHRRFLDVHMSITRSNYKMYYISVIINSKLYIQIYV